MVREIERKFRMISLWRKMPNYLRRPFISVIGLLMLTASPAFGKSSPFPPGWEVKLIFFGRGGGISFDTGGGVAKDIDNIAYLAKNMLGRTFCPLGDAAAMPTIAFVEKFREEFEDHLNGKPCPYAKERVGELVPA